MTNFPDLHIGLTQLFKSGQGATGEAGNVNAAVIKAAGSLS